MDILKDWVCTDPDTLQFCKKLSEKVFELKEFNMVELNPNTTSNMNYVKDKQKLPHLVFAEKYWNEEELWVEEEIDLDDYSEEEIQEYMDAYGYDYDGENVIFPTGQFYPNNALIAETIFEQITQY